MNHSQPCNAAEGSWVVTTRVAPWRKQSGLEAAAITGAPDGIVPLNHPQQVIEGFGPCFNLTYPDQIEDGI